MKNIPRKGPLIIAANHQNGLIEAMLIPSFIFRVLTFLTRGDVFNPKFRWFFKAVNMMPIYRFKDGFSNLRNNQSVFHKAYEALTIDQCILIFSEAKFEIAKKLRPVKKGTAKLAFGAMDAFESLGDLKIVPMAVNYTAPLKARSDVIFDIGKPIDLAEYYEVFKEDDKKAITALTQDLEKAILKHMIHIEDQEKEAQTEIALEIARNEWRKGKIALDRLAVEQKVCAHTNNMSQEDWVFEKEKLSEYGQHISSAKISDRAVSLDGFTILLKCIIGLILLVPAITGAMFIFIPYRVANIVTKKRLKEPHFYTTVHFPVCFAVYLILIILASIVFLIVLGWQGFIAILLCIVCSYTSLLLWDGQKTLRQFLRFQFLKKEKKSKIRNQRESIRHRYLDY